MQRLWLTPQFQYPFTLAHLTSCWPSRCFSDATFVHFPSQLFLKFFYHLGLATTLADPPLTPLPLALAHLTLNVESSRCFSDATFVHFTSQLFLKFFGHLGLATTLADPPLTPLPLALGHSLSCWARLASTSLSKFIGFPIFSLNPKPYSLKRFSHNFYSSILEIPFTEWQDLDQDEKNMRLRRNKKRRKK